MLQVFLLAVLHCYNLSGLLQSFSNNSRTSATNPLERIGPKRYSTSNPHVQVQKKICLHYSLSIVAIFVISFSPMAIFSSVLVPVLIYKKEVVPLYNASVILLFISSSLNPGLYLWRMTCTYPK